MKIAIIISAITIILMIVCIIKFPKIKIKQKEIQTFWIIPLIGALSCLLFKTIDTKSVLEGLLSNTSVNPLKILILFFSMTFMSIVLDELGFFEYLANLALKKAKSNQKVLFFILYLLTSLLTIFTSNDIIILTFTPFIIFFTKRSKINPIPYLVSEFVAANTWSMMFIIGNPTNIYLATSNNIAFLNYFMVMILPTITAGTISLLILYAIFHKELNKQLEIEEKEIRLENKPLLTVNLLCLGICTIILIISSYIHLEMYLVALVFALVLLTALIINAIINKKATLFKESMKRLPWSLAPFLISMFVIVLMLEEKEVTKAIASVFSKGPTVLTYGFSSTILCNLINNIPMSVLFAKIIPLNNFGALYATIIGSNIGAFLSPIGALAGIMWLTILKKYDIKYRFWDFVKYGVIIAFPTLLSSLLVLMIIL